MTRVDVVTCFIEFEGKILLLRRSQAVGSYQQRWAGISGYIEPGNTPLAQAKLEIEEELGLDPENLVLVKEGEPIEVVDRELDRTWIVHPFRFRVSGELALKTNWEHTECRWIAPQDIVSYDTVPQLDAAWESVK